MTGAGEPSTPARASVEARLALLEAEREIMRTLHAYSHALDYGDEDARVDCWLPDGVIRWPPPYPASFEGHEGMRTAFRGHSHAPRVWHKHLVADPRIDVTGDTAHVVSYFARLDQDEDGPYLRNFGRYLDVLQRCADGRWRFKERRAEAEATSPKPRPGGPQGSATSP